MSTLVHDDHVETFALGLDEIRDMLLMQVDQVRIAEQQRGMLRLRHASQNCPCLPEVVRQFDHFQTAEAPCEPGGLIRRTVADDDDLADSRTCLRIVRILGMFFASL